MAADEYIRRLFIPDHALCLSTKSRCRTIAGMEDFLGTLLGSSARAKVLRIFALNPQVFTVAHISKRAGVSPRTAKTEIAQLERWGVIKKTKMGITLGEGEGRRTVSGKQKELMWAFDQTFKHATALSRFVHETSPVEHKQILSGLKRAGRISTIVLSGVFVGDSSRPADIVIAADSLNETKLEAAMKAIEPQLGREIRYAALTTPEFRYRLTIQDRLLRETLDFPHLVLFDKTQLL